MTRNNGNGNPSKSDQIRNFLEDNGSATVPEIVQGLKAQGVKVSPALASKIKYARPQGGKKPKNGRRKGAKPGNRLVSSAASSGLDIGALVRLKNFAEGAGGIEVVEGQLNTLKALKSAGI